MNPQPLLVFVLFLLTFSLVIALECQVTENACNNPGEAILLCLSDQTNAHAELPQRSGDGQTCPTYRWKLCCADPFVSNECTGEYETVGWLSDTTNAHFAREQNDAYSIPFCLRGLRDVQCKANSFSGASCVFSFSDKTNAHVGSCGTSGYTDVYCSLTSDQDGDTFSANEDCDDDNKNVNPTALEIGDGLDNNCDGFVDGDDPGMFTLPRGWYQVSQDLNSENFQAYSAEGVEVKQLETGQRVFVITDSERKGLVSKKVKIEKNKEYVATVDAWCEATLQLVFEDAIAETEESSFFGLVGGDLIHSVVGKGRLDVQANSGESEYAAIFLDVKGKDCVLSQPQLELKGRLSPADYNDALGPRALPIKPETTFAAASCCPENSCWNGFTCVENMRDNTIVFENVSGKAVYRCIDGNWVFRAQLYDWNNQEFGSCPGEGQCFVLSSQKGATVSAKPNDFYAGKFPLCVESGEYIFDHYCQEGVWLSRTQFVAEQLLKAAGTNDYTLYCTDPEEALVDFDYQEQYVLGGFPTVVEAKASPLLGSSEKVPSRLCFSTVGGAVQNLVSDAENQCINNVCLLLSGDTLSFAMTLNKEVSDPIDSFVKALGISPEDFLESCSGSDEYKTCVLPGLEGKVYYSPSFNALIYSKEALSFEPSLLEMIFTFIKDLFGTPEEKLDKNTISHDRALREIFLLQKGDKTVRAFREKTASDKEVLTAEYQGFATPICTFVEHLLSPTKEAEGALGLVAGEKAFSCTFEDGTQKVIAVEDVGYLWPQLTGKLRIE